MNQSMNGTSPTERQSFDLSAPRKNTSPQTPRLLDESSYRTISSATSTLSSSKGTRRLTWKRRPYVRFPLDDERGERPLLSAADVDVRIKQWENLGLDTRGFQLGDSNAREASDPQSCDLYPDPRNIAEECARHGVVINVPSQPEWDYRRRSMQEERLRSLAVSSNQETGQQSSVSRASRASSQSVMRPERNSLTPPIPSISPGAYSSHGTSGRPAGPFFSSANGLTSAVALQSQRAHSQPPQYRARSPFVPGSKQFRKPSPLSQPYAFSMHPWSSPNNFANLPQAWNGFSTAYSPIVHRQGLPSTLIDSHPRTVDSRRHSAMSDQGTWHGRSTPRRDSAPSNKQNTTYSLPSQTLAFADAKRNGPDILQPMPRSHHHELDINGTLPSEDDMVEHGINVTPRPGNTSGAAVEPANVNALKPHESRAPYLVPCDRSQRHTEGTLESLDRSISDGHSESMFAHPQSYALDSRPAGMDSESQKAPLSKPRHLEQWQASWWKESSSKGPSEASTHPLSKLNVNAKEFEFKPPLTSSATDVPADGLNFQPTFSVDHATNTHTQFSLRSSRAVKGKRGLNVDAPSFMPSSIPHGAFKFSNASLNVEAPIFNPGQQSVKHHTEEPSGTALNQAGERIFSVLASDVPMEPARRGKVTKTPSRRDRNEEVYVEDDENGRLQLSTARQKRARRHNEDQDDVAHYDQAVPPANEGVTTMNVAQASMAASQSSAAVNEIVIGADDNELHTVLLGDEKPRESPRAKICEDVVSSDKVTGSLIRSLEDTELQEAFVHKISVSGAKGVLEEERMGTNDANNDPSNPDSTTTSPLSCLSDEAADEPPVSSSMASLSHVSTEQNLSCDDAEVLALSSPERGRQGVRSRVKSGEAVMSHPIAQDLRESLPSDNNSAQRSQDTSPSATDNAVAAKVLDHQTEDGQSKADLSIAPYEEAKTPSYDAIDAVMKQLEEDSDLGVEREESPRMPRETPAAALPPSASIVRSHAPSPSPSHTRTNSAQIVYEMEDKFANSQTLSTSSVSQPSSIDQFQGIVIEDRRAELSEQEARLGAGHPRSSDSHVGEVIGGILGDHLVPFAKTLHTIQASISALAGQKQHLSRQTSRPSKAVEESDADDEDDERGEDEVDDGKKECSVGGESMESRPRAIGPRLTKKSQTSEAIKAAVVDALAAYKLGTSSSGEFEHSGLERVLNEVKSAKDASTTTDPRDIKAIVEDVISTHPRLREKRAQQDHEAEESEKLKLQLSGFESMLKIANERAEEDYRARKDAENELVETNRQLNLAVEEAAQYREAAEEAEVGLRSYHKEKESVRQLEQTNAELSLKNAALETTLEEYRLSRDMWYADIKPTREENDNLKATLQALQREMEDMSQSKQTLRAKVEKLRSDLTDVVGQVATEQSSSARREQALSAQLQETELKVLDEYRLSKKLEVQLEKSNLENVRLLAAMEQAREESRVHEDTIHRSNRELAEARDTTQVELSRLRSTYEHESRLADSHHSTVCANFESRISCLETQLHQTQEEARSTQKRRQDILEEEVIRHREALHEVRESQETNLAGLRFSHEKTLNDLRERHARALHNASDDKHRLEANLVEKLALKEDKVQHLEGKVSDLQSRLEVDSIHTRERAQSTSSSSREGAVRSETVPLANSASISLAKGSNIPEKISPQALRESILVLQDQLQNREQNIEYLEAELGKRDHDLPEKLRQRDAEVTWLRELLAVRLDDLEEIINTLSRPDFDREIVQDATIRLKANLEMEQQERERLGLASNNNNARTVTSFPSISGLSNLTQTPRALPMAAALALGNWKKARDSLSSATESFQTTSRVEPDRQSFLSGLLTPPRTSQKTAAMSVKNGPPTVRSLNGRKFQSDSRALRGRGGLIRSISTRPERVAGNLDDKSGPQLPMHPQRQPVNMSSPSTPLPNRALSFTITGHGGADDTAAVKNDAHMKTASSRGQDQEGERAESTEITETANEIASPSPGVELGKSLMLSGLDDDASLIGSELDGNITAAGTAGAGAAADDDDKDSEGGVVRETDG